MFGRRAARAERRLARDWAMRARETSSVGLAAMAASIRRLSWASPSVSHHCGAGAAAEAVSPRWKAVAALACGATAGGPA